MIVNYTERGWSIVLQRAHGLLAAQICGQWKRDNQPERWVETLIATAEHDDGKDEMQDSDLIQENGGPKNFKMNPFQKDSCESLIERAMLKSRYIGILTSMHMRFLYQSDVSAKQYCRSLAVKEKRWISEADTTAEQVSASYELLEFCDSFSLLICQDLIQPEQRKMEISNGPDGKVYQLSMAENGNMIVDPWPFQNDSFTVGYERREMSQLAFSSNAEFIAKLKSVKVIMQMVTISRN